MEQDITAECKEYHNLHFSPDVTWLTKSSGIKWEGT
jgi:hypothetical protein